MNVADLIHRLHEARVKKLQTEAIAKEANDEYQQLSEALAQEMIDEDVQQLNGRDGRGCYIRQDLNARIDKSGEPRLIEDWIADVGLQTTVHASTLTAWCKEMVRDGREDEIPGFVKVYKTHKAIPKTGDPR